MDWVKLEVFGDSRMFFLNLLEIVVVIECFVFEGFYVFCYISDDLVVVKCFKELGVVFVMLVGFFIGLG